MSVQQSNSCAVHVPTVQAGSGSETPLATRSMATASNEDEKKPKMEKVQSRVEKKDDRSKQDGSSNQKTVMYDDKKIKR